MNPERLALLSPDRFKLHESSATVTVQETNQEGAATVRICIPDGQRALEMRLHNHPETLLRDAKNADGHLALERRDGTWTLLAIECKKTLDENRWKTAEEQLCASLTRMTLITDFLGMQVTNRRAWVATREDRLSPQKNPNPIQYKAGVGVSSPSSAAQRWAQRRLPTGPCHPEVHIACLLLDKATGEGQLPL